MTPTITVLMAAYNATDYIKESIQSILNQTYEDFELLIINDGSTDDTVAVINNFQDPRIRLLHNPENKGLTYSRNVSLTAARGAYIAILDSDDIASPNRLALQYDFFKSHPEVVVCGGHARIINQKGEELEGRTMRVPVGIDCVKATLLFHNPFVNSTTMFRTDVFKSINGYRNDAEFVEDYDLFIRISEQYAVANIDQVLVRYRIHENNTSILNREISIAKEKQIKQNQLKSLGLPTDQHRTDILHTFQIADLSLFSITEYQQLFKELKTANRKLQKYPLNAFEKLIFEQWYEVIFTKKPKMNALSLFLNPTLFNLSALTFRQIRKIIKLSIKGFGQRLN